MSKSQKNKKNKAKRKQKMKKKTLFIKLNQIKAREYKQMNKKLKSKNKKQNKKVTMESGFMVYLKTKLKIHLTRHKNFNFKSYLQ